MTPPASSLPFTYDPSHACYIAHGRRGWWEVRVNDCSGLVRWAVTLDGKPKGTRSTPDLAKQLAASLDYS